MVQLIRVPAAEAPRPTAGAIVIDLVEARARITVEAGADAGTLKTVLAALGVRGAA